MKYVGLMTQRTSGGEDVKIILKNIMGIFFPIGNGKKKSKNYSLPENPKDDEGEGRGRKSI